MLSAVKTLTFATRWPNIALWDIVVLHCPAGGFRAEYISGSERQNPDTPSQWTYDFMIQANDLPAGVTFDQIINSFLVTPYVTQFSPCVATQSNCFAAIPELPNGTPAEELAVIVGPDACGRWCVYRTTAADHDPYWTP